jgi:hypothetical protein
VPQAASAQDKPFTLTLTPEASAGPTVRLNDAATGYPISERGAVNYQLGLYLGLGQRADIGVRFLHTGLGVETTTNVATESGVRSRRSMNSGAIDARVFAWRNSWAALFVGFNVGLGWQKVDHTITRVEQPFSAPLVSRSRCEVRGGPGLGLGAGLGGEFDLEENTSFVLSVSGMTNRFSSDPIEGCADGAGTVNLFLAQIGFLHRFDLGGSKGKK